jgi:rhomboid-like protein
MIPPITPVIKNLLIINVIVFFFIAITSMQLPIIRVYMPLHNFQSPAFQPFQFVSSMFTHLDIGHIFFNMLILYFFGPMVENRIGSQKTFIAFLSGGLFSAIIFFVVFSFFLSEPFYLLGASGAVYTVIVLAALYFPDRKASLLFIPVQFPLGYMAAAFITLDILLLKSGANTGVAHLAHLGGAALGFILYYLWEKR